MSNIDTFDRKILYELDCNGRTTYTQIAKKLRSSKTTVKYRVERLIRENIIIGFNAIIDFSLLGYSIYRINIRLKNCPPEIEKSILDYLISQNNIYVLFKVNGPYHLVLGVKAKNIWELNLFWEGFNNQFFNYLHSSHLSLVFDYIEFTRSYLLPTPKDKAQFATLKKIENYELDEIDYKLLDYLSKNGRTDLVELSKKLGKSAMVIRHRLKNLQKNKIIIGFRAMINHEKLGYQYYKVDMILSSKKNFKELKQFILSHPNVVYTEKSLITSDFEFDLEVKDFLEFTRIMESFKSKFPNDIQDYTYYSLVKSYKLF
ncbi:MAG: Lrp/AsnC family transcriptional regulator [Candidatus ainarchaeum sp.]|nr:Lrp/AsnC family transcriptional regulator [Candidatus ainarchaeum sp.]